MKKALVASACAIALCGTAIPASAAGLYLGGMIGGANTTGAQYDEPNHTSPGYLPLPFQNGVAGSAVLGFAAPGWRYEGELTFRNHNIANSSTFEGTIAGHARIFGVMANGWYDLNPIGQGIVPYFGGGIGLANVHVDLTNTDTNFGGATGSVNGNSIVVAIQAGAGVAIGLGKTAITIDYRMLATGPISISADLPPFGVKGTLISHSLMAGIRMSLGP